MRRTMPSASSCRSCWMSIFCEIAGIAFSQLGEAQHLSAEEPEQDHQLPASFEKLEGLLHLGGRGAWRSARRPCSRVSTLLFRVFLPYRKHSCNLGFRLQARRNNPAPQADAIGEPAMTADLPPPIAAYFAAANTARRRGHARALRPGCGRAGRGRGAWRHARPSAPAIEDTTRRYRALVEVSGRGRSGRGGPSSPGLSPAISPAAP